MKSHSKFAPAGILPTLFLGFLIAHASPVHAAEWRAIGPYGGSVQKLERCVSQPTVIYAWSSQAGIFRSEDSGLTWRGASGGLAPQEFSDLAVDPSNPNAAWLLSTTSTLYRTRDGGAHWSQVSSPGETSRIAVAPGEGNVLYLGGRSGLFRSIDGGASWRLAKRGLATGYGVVSIAVDLLQPSLVYAAVRGDQPGLYVSRNAGASWRRTLPRFQRDVQVLRADPHLAGAVVGSTSNGLLRSLDSGQTWRPLGPPADPVTVGRFPDFAFGSGRPSNLFLVADDPFAVAVFVVDGTTERISRLIDDTENRIPRTISANFGSDGDVLIGGFSGLRRTTDGGVTWLDSTRGFAAKNAGRVAAPGRTDLLAGNERTEDGGGHWTPFLLNQRVTDLAFDPTDRDTLYATTSLGNSTDSTFERVWKSLDGGVSWQPASAGINISEPSALAIDRARPERLYFATTFSVFDGDFYGGLFQSDDGAASWRRNESLGRGDVFDVELDAASCVYVALGASLRRSCDAGATFTTLLDGTLPEVESRSLEDVEVAPSDRRWIYVVEGYRSDDHQRLWRSRDSGSTFEPIDLPLAEVNSNIASSAIAVDARHPEVVYLALATFGNDGGVWRRREDGPWQNLSETLFNRSVVALRFDARPHPRLLASTGAGVRVFDLAPEP